MKVYQAKTDRWHGTSYGELIKSSRQLFKVLERKTKRRPYLRSAYFDKQKIFLDYFWPHLNQKSPAERVKRLLYLPCAVELIEKSRFAPLSKTNPNRRDETLHRFSGLTKDQELFHVQIKEDLKSKQKFLMSVFPPG